MARFQLVKDDRGLCLRDTFSVQKPLRVDFGGPGFVARLRRAGRKSELVARAVKTRPGLRVLDCTAGLARDAFVLAYLGCHVTLVERSAVVARLLEDGLRRAMGNERLIEAASRMTLRPGDARTFLKNPSLCADVVYMDPMFPEQAGAAEVRGGMRHLRRFLGSDDDALGLLSLALASPCARIVLKRPAKSQWRPPVTPSHVFGNRNSRYEVFVR